MSIQLYMDVHIPRAITEALRLRGVDVFTAQDDRATRLDDDALLYRATQLQRILFTRDDDLLRIAKHLNSEGIAFAGVIYSHQLKTTIGKCVADLEIIAKTCEPDDLTNRVEYLPL